MRWLLALFALVLPPLALAGRGSLAARAAAPVLWVAALGIFFGLAWGPGLLLALLAGIIAALQLLRRR